MKTKNEPLPEIPNFGLCFIPAAPAAYLERIRDEIPQIAPELGELSALAIVEESYSQAAEKFSEGEAKSEHEAQSAELRSDPTPANIEKLKTLGSLAEKLGHFGAEYRKLQGAAFEVRKSGLPMIDAVTRRLCARLMALADEARADEIRLFSDWGLTAPEPSEITPHVHRAIQDIAENLRRESAELPHGVGIRGFLRMLGQE